MAAPPDINLKALVTNARSLQPNTRRGYLATVKRWLDFAGSDPAGWTAQQAQLFYEALLSDNLSIRSANNMVTGGLAYVFGRAHALYGIPDITRAIDKAKDEEDDDSRRHALSPAQGRALLAATTQHGTDLLALRDYAACILGFYTGLRREGLVALRLENIEVEPDVVFLKTVVKGGRSADIPIAPYVWGYLHDYRQALGRTRGPLLPRVSQVSIKTDERDASQPMTGDGLYKALVRVAQRAGAKFTPHIFRHTFTTWCRQAKIEDYLIEVVTAHRSNRGLVDRVYTDRRAMSADVAARCAAAVDAKLFPKD